MDRVDEPRPMAKELAESCQVVGLRDWDAEPGFRAKGRLGRTRVGLGFGWRNHDLGLRGGSAQLGFRTYVFELRDQSLGAPGAD